MNRHRGAKRLSRRLLVSASVKYTVMEGWSSREGFRRCANHLESSSRPTPRTSLKRTPSLSVDFGTIIGTTRRLLLGAPHLPDRLWADAFKAAVYIKNRTPTDGLDGKAPLEVWEDKKLGHLLHMHTKADLSDMPSQQPTEQPRTSPPRSRVSEHMPQRPSRVCLPECSVSRAMATGAVEA